MQRTFLIDTDGGSDDVVALIMALRSPLVRVAAITTVAGNVPVGQATRNVLYTVELCGAGTPVYAGAEEPLVEALETAQWFHGKDGLGDHGYAPKSRQAETAHAVDAIIETVSANPGIEVVTLGPLTNLALAIRKAPGLVRSIGRLVVMGGAPCCEGNVTPAAEFNIWVDPEAAKMVFRAGLPREMVGWHLCRGQAALNPRDIAGILSIGTPLAEFVIRSNSVAAEAYRVQTGEVGISLPDPITMAIALRSELCTASSLH
ncbi:MAG TPA: nucleoside hydrolase, partial [Candidatus Acidoferrum sp.]|nr:nucleoside hydrolase [Candidatus Acidoferrum sp.]